MSLSATALVTLVQAKNYLRVDPAASLQINAEFVDVGGKGINLIRLFSSGFNVVKPADATYLNRIDGTRI